MVGVSDERAISERYRLLQGQQGSFDERARRLWAAAEARAIGRGGVAAVVRATGISESTVRRGLLDLEREEQLEPGRVRRPGAGRSSIARREPGLADDLDRLIEPVRRRVEQPPLRWTCKSGAKLAVALRERGHRVVDRTVLRLLRSQGYSLQANRHIRDGARHPDRDAQFEYINRTVTAAVAAGQPVISVEIHGRAAGRPAEAIERALAGVKGELGLATPGELTSDQGWVQLGITPETAQLTVDAILGWWDRLGKARYPDAAALTVTADCGGSSSERARAWTVELQRASGRTGLELVVCHFPAGTTRWELVRHRLRNFVGVTRREGLQISHQIVISLIAPPSPEPLTTFAWLDVRDGVRVTEGTAEVNLARATFQGDWNYRIKPVNN